MLPRMRESSACRGRRPIREQQFVVGGRVVMRGLALCCKKLPCMAAGSDAARSEAGSMTCTASANRNPQGTDVRVHWYCLQYPFGVITHVVMCAAHLDVCGAARSAGGAPEGQHDGVAAAPQQHLRVVHIRLAHHLDAVQVKELQRGFHPRVHVHVTLPAQTKEGVICLIDRLLDFLLCSCGNSTVVRCSACLEGQSSDRFISVIR